MGVAAPLGVSASGRSPYWPDDDANGVVQGTLAAVRAGKPFAFMGPMNLWIWASLNVTLTVNAASLTAQVSSAGALAAGTSVNSSLLPRGTTMSGITGTDITLVLPIYSYWGKTKVGIAKITDLPSTEWLLGAAVTGPGIPASTTVSSIDTVAVAPNPNYEGIKGVVTISNAVTSAPVQDIRSPFEFGIAVGVVAAGVDTAATFTGAAIVFNATVQLERTFDGGYSWLPANIGGAGMLARWSAGTPVSISFGEPEKQVLYRLNAVAYTGITATTLNYRISETGQAATTLSVPTL